MMTAITLRILRARFGEVRCKSCDVDIKVGDKVVSTGRGGFTPSYWVRHEECWKKLFR